MKLPPIPPKLQAPDAESVRQLRLAVKTIPGRRQAHDLADMLERLIDVNAHNERVAREALATMREILGEVEG